MSPRLTTYWSSAADQRCCIHSRICLQPSLKPAATRKRVRWCGRQSGAGKPGARLSEREHGRHDWLDEAAIDQLFHLDELLPA